MSASLRKRKPPRPPPSAPASFVMIPAAAGALWKSTKATRTIPTRPRRSLDLASASPSAMSSPALTVSLSSLRLIPRLCCAIKPVAKSCLTSSRPAAVRPSTRWLLPSAQSTRAPCATPIGSSSVVTASTRRAATRSATSISARWARRTTPNGPVISTRWPTAPP